MFLKIIIVKVLQNFVLDREELPRPLTALGCDCKESLNWFLNGCVVSKQDK